MSFAIDTPTIEDPNAPAPELSNEQLRAALASSDERAVRAEQERDRERDRLDTFLTTPPVSATPAAKLTPEPLPPMPDIVEHPDEYRTWHLEKDRRAQVELDVRLDRETTERRADIAEAESRANLWGVFQASYPEHAALSDLVRPAYANLLQRGKLPHDTSGISKAIAEEMNSMVGVDIKSIKKTADRSSGTSAGETPQIPKPKVETDDPDNVTIHSAVSAFKIKHGLI